MTATTSFERRTKPPFRADHVGSLLRPDALKVARDRYLGPQTPETNLGPHESAELRRRSWSPRIVGRSRP